MTALQARPCQAKLLYYAARTWTPVSGDARKVFTLLFRPQQASVAISRPPASTLQFYPIYNLDVGHKKTIAINITNYVIVGREGGNNISFGSKISWRENWARRYINNSSSMVGEELQMLGSQNNPILWSMSWNRFNISIQLLSRIVGLNIKVCILFIHWRLVSKTFCINAKFSQQQTKMLFSYKTLFSSQNKTFLCWTAAVVFTWYLEDSFSESEVSKMNWSGDFSFLVTAMERPDSTRVWHRKISFQEDG